MNIVIPAYAQYYQYDDSAAVATAYPWINIAAPAGTGVGLNDDQATPPLNLGFTFNFGGTNYTRVRISANGLLMFSGITTEYSNSQLPLTGAGGEPNIDFVMAPLWDDYQPDNDSNLIRYDTQGTAPNRIFIVSWLNLPYYCWNRNGLGCSRDNQTTTADVTFQVQIYEQGFFVYRYGATNGSGGAHSGWATYSNNGATVGVEIDNTDYVQYSYNVAAVPNGRTILWTNRSATAIPGGFNAFETTTATGAISGVIKTKISGANNTLAIIALNAAKTAVETNFNGDVKVELLDTSDNSGVLNAATGCRSSWVPLTGFAPLTLTFAISDAGRKNITFNESNAWKNIRVRITYPLVGGVTAQGCSSDNFAIRPSAFTGLSVTDSNWQTAGTPRSLNNTNLNGGNVHAAGRPFTVQANAVNAGGTPVVTTNYIDTPVALLSACGGTACTASFGTLNLGASTIAGVINSSTASYSEVGSFSLQLIDQTFANVDAADSTTAERYISSPSIVVGRFVPDHFSVDFSTGNAPLLTNRSDINAGTGCVPASSFTYMDETFGLRYRIEARTYNASMNSDGTTGMRTQNYTGVWAKGMVGLMAENNNAGSDLGGRLANILGSWNSGVYTANVNNAQFIRNSTPDGPYDSLQLGVSVTDSDGPILENRNMQPATTSNCVSANNCTGVALATTSMRFGQMRLSNAYGSELLALPIPLSVQYWNGTGFVDHSNDQCTRLNSTDIVLIFYPASSTNALAACETSINLSALIAGNPFNNYILSLTRPGTGNFGWVDLRINLGTATPSTTCIAGTSVPLTAANKTYLRSNWGGGAYDKDPVARARFGTARGDRGVIYIRENF